MGAHRHVACQAKVTELGVHILVQKHILRLQVPMQYAIRVQIIERRHQMTDNSLCMILGHGTIEGQISMQIHECEFGDHKQVEFGFERLNHFYDMGMLEARLYVAFAAQILQLTIGATSLERYC